MPIHELIVDNKLIASVILVITALLLRWLLLRLIGKRKKHEEDLPQRRINGLNNATSLLLMVGLIAIWMSELRYFALSMAAFAVAFVVATREYIQCMLGAIYIASTRPFVVGDWIQVGDYSGEVVSSDWLTTSLLEIDLESQSYGYSGKTLILPNNLFATKGVHNLNFMRRYVAHSFTIVRDPDWVNVFAAKQYILDCTNASCEPFQDVAERYNAMIEKRLGIPISGPHADVRISTNATAKNLFTITLFCPTQEAVRIEQEITEKFMAFWYAEMKKAKAELPLPALNAELKQQQDKHKQEE
ncbi:MULTISPECIES: mechanosensitive ion channel family protein [Corallincola]|uniref:Mechanosensitive ion channel family protein n=2 Tax=Corallincola TaxID=1775176 RepID=A0ABY1WNI3_9GAMM|nr:MULTISPECIES: mechanosensitive ion channel family protein [Corallincola]TAA45104.1 mechanosensitive ion channel family protein [Corallincola spongiicola]TCI03618.1 mechanosensitive ion channel family protein [Corallincola luteus]